MKSLLAIWFLPFCLLLVLPIHSVAKNVAKDMLASPKLRIPIIKERMNEIIIPDIGSLLSMSKENGGIRMYIFKAPFLADSLRLKTDDTHQIIQLFVDGLKNLRNEKYALALENFKAAKEINDQPVLTQCIAQARFFLEEEGIGPSTSNTHYYLAIVHYTKLNKVLLELDLAQLFDTQNQILSIDSCKIDQGKQSPRIIYDTVKVSTYTWKSDEELREYKEIKYFAALAGISIDSYNDRNIELFVDKLKNKYNTQLFALLYNQANIALYSGLNESDEEKKKVNFELAKSCFDQAFTYIEKFPEDQDYTREWKSRTNYDYGILLYEASDGQDVKALDHIQLAVNLGHKDPNNILTSLEFDTAKK